MSKRVANTKERTARNGRVRYGWSRAAKIAARAEVALKRKAATRAMIPKPRPRVKVKPVSLWNKVKNYVRRKCGKS